MSEAKKIVGWMFDDVNKSRIEVTNNVIYINALGYRVDDPDADPIRVEIPITTSKYIENFAEAAKFVVDAYFEARADEQARTAPSTPSAPEEKSSLLVKYSYAEDGAYVYKDYVLHYFFSIHNQDAAFQYVPIFGKEGWNFNGVTRLRNNSGATIGISFSENRLKDLLNKIEQFKRDERK